MKIMNIYKKVLFLALGVATLSLQSCKDDDQPGGGMPMVNYIRCLSSEIKADNDPADMHYTNGELVEKAAPQSVLALVGDNLTSVKEIWFNDKKATLNTSYITDKSLIVSIPREVPRTVTNKIYLINAAKDTVKVDFLVDVPAPEITTMSCEYAQPGEEVTLYGSYMVSYSDVPFQVFFKDVTGAPIEAYVKSIAENNMSAVVIVPEGAAEGEITASSRYGSASTSFHYRDTRGMLIDFEKDVQGPAWHKQTVKSDEWSVAGNYLELACDLAGDLSDWPDTGGHFEYWFNGNDVPALNTIADFSNWQKLALKFEVLVPAATPWKGCALEVIFADADAVSASNANNTYFHDEDPTIPRAFYRPWLETGSFDTQDKWMTVTLPLATSFAYDCNGKPATGMLTKDSFVNLELFLYGGGIQGAPCSPVIKIDNVRVVPNK